YVCPMDEGVRATDETFKDLDGRCPICGMELVKIKPRRPAGWLHDGEYSFDVHAHPERPLGGTIELVVKRDGNAEVKLALMHEQLMHLILVSEDLSYFNHTHPTFAEASGNVPATYTLACSFPRAGNYVLFADFTPRGDREQVIRVPLAAD